jgi:hypothetical protein
MSTRPNTIFIFSLEPWGDMWYSKHHYAACLAKRSPVYFISVPDRWRWRDLFSFKIKVREVADGLHVVEYRNNLPIRLLPAWLAALVFHLNALKLLRLVPGENALFWCFHPTRMLDGPLLRKRGSKIIYHVVDPYQNLPNDDRFARRADLVVGINPWYVDYYQRRNPNCLLIPHGVRRMDRSQEARPWTDERVHGDYAVMAAGINHYTNYPLLIDVATAFPKLHLVIVGQLFHVDEHIEEIRQRLFAMPNVSFIGVKHPDELRTIIHGAKVGLVTYDFEPTRSVPVSGVRTPLKAITYLAQNCPVVSTLNSYVPTLEGQGCFKAENATHFVQLIGEVLDGTRKVNKVVVERYLDEVDYDRLIDRVLERVYAGAPAAPEQDRTDQRPCVPAECPVLIVSNEEWNGPRYSKHRYALALQKHRQVYFIDPASQWRPSHFFQWRVRSRSTPEGVIVLSYRNLIPLLGGRLAWINDRVIARRLRRYVSQEHTEKPLFWSFDPARLLNPRHLGASRSVYHCVDDHTNRREEERELARNADHVLCIARELMERFITCNDSVQFVPHGLSDTDFDSLLPTNGLPAPRGYALYIGNINDRHDFALWERLFAAHPDQHFVIVGPWNVTDPVGRRLYEERPYPNVHFLRPVRYEMLAPLIAGSGCGFLFLKREHPANRISSQKVVQFMAQGKPFFCSWLSEYADRRHLVHMSDSHEEALEQFAAWHHHGERPEAREQRLAFANTLRFDHLIEHLPFRL